MSLHQALNRFELEYYWYQWLIRAMPWTENQPPGCYKKATLPISLLAQKWFGFCSLCTICCCCSYFFCHFSFSFSFSWSNNSFAWQGWQGVPANSCNCRQPSGSFVCLNLGLFAKVEEADRVYWDTVDKGWQRLIKVDKGWQGWQRYQHPSEKVDKGWQR